MFMADSAGYKTGSYLLHQKGLTGVDLQSIAIRQMKLVTVAAMGGKRAKGY
jgi:hypothetical protein